MHQHPIDSLKKIIKDLRHPDGCPWDIKQTPQSITPHIIEEAYELVDAIQSNCNDNILDELSDQLLHVVMISQMIQESGGFEFNDVADHCSKKMIRRHPHIFNKNGEKKKKSNPVNVPKEWEKIKSNEHPEKSPLDGIPIHLPALLHAEKTQKRVAQVGFDWPDINGPLDKLTEECEELKSAVNNDHIDEEIGDILFTIVNICRKHERSAESLLQNSIKKFKSRFKTLETITKHHKKKLSQCSAEELELLWDQAKKV